MPESPKKPNQEPTIKRIAVLGVDALTKKAVVVVHSGERLVPNPRHCAGQAAFTGTVEQLDQEAPSPEHSEATLADIPDQPIDLQ